MIWAQAARLNEISRGNDPSFFYRVQGPAIAGLDSIVNLPVAGAGLTGAPYIEGRVVDLHVRSPAAAVLHQRAEATEPERRPVPELPRDLQARLAVLRAHHPAPERPTLTHEP
ncbi:hypothetical protein [Reyranella sp.]|uniref:hypothetical protein n=1 Tax=Reyranella sp. TaxID=1929291 RepID=UPI002F94D0A0